MKILLLSFFVTVLFQSFCQNYVVDPTFNNYQCDPNNQSFNKPSIQTDGKIIIGGSFANYDGYTANNLVRLDSDGFPDNSFNIGSGFNGYCGSSLQSDGKIVLAGDFTSFDGIVTNRIVRLLPNGSIDNSFLTGLGFDSTVNWMAIQNDGKIILGGLFTSYNGSLANGIIRLNNDGTIDNSFATVGGFDKTVYSISFQNDGKIVLSGNFTSFNGFPQTGIIRLSANGTIDNSFNPGSGFSGGVGGIFTETFVFNELQSDGRIVVTGNFTVYDGNNCMHIARLNPDGSFDNTFDIGSGLEGDPTGFLLGSSWGSSIKILDNDKILLGGNFSSYNGTNKTNICRLNSEGTLDDFDTGSSIGIVSSIEIQPNGKIILYDTSFDPFGNPTSTFFVKRLSSPCVNAINNNIDTSVCEQYISPLNNTYSQSGIYNETIIDGNGCDSVYLTINLTIIQPSQSSFDASFCNGSVYTWNGQEYSQPGQYVDTLLNQFGCDSIVTLNLSIVGSDFNGTSETVSPSMCTTPTGEIHVILGGNSVFGNSVFFSEYYSGNSFEKAIEIYNSNDSIFDLGQNFNPGGSPIYAKIKNSSNQVLSFAPGTIIPPHSTLIISHPNSSIVSNLTSSIIDGSSLTGYYILEAFGLQDNWDVAIPSEGNSVIRKNTINNNNSNYDSNEWNILPLNDNTLGSHYNNTFDYSIQWSTGEIIDSLIAVAPGDYTYNVIHDLSGCIVASETVTVPTTGNNFNPNFSSTQQLYTAPPFAVQFSNSTPNFSNYTFTWDFGDGTTLASNNATVFHEYLYNGQYTVSLIATDNVTGCSDTLTMPDYIYCTGGVSCTHAANINQASPQQACQGDSIWLTCNSDPSFSYQWRKNGVVISGNNNDSLLITQSGTYSVIISVNSCPVISNDVTVTILSTPTIPVITSSGSIQPCIGGAVTLSTGTYATYNWSTGATSQNISVSNSGVFSVNVTDANGCSASSAPYIVNASFIPAPTVCIVGMDSLTNENRIIWEKPISAGIDSFYVYKETNVADVYTKIGGTAYSDLAVFLDVNSNPAVQAYRYKISALDTCSTETNLSDFHKSIHLTINQGVGSTWNLIWSHYEGLTFGSYNIYRGTNPSNISLLTTVQSNLTSYTDLTPPSGAVYYQIEVVNPVNCDPTKSINYGVSRSNIVNSAGAGINEEIVSEIKVYPNPTHNKLTLAVSTDLIGETYAVRDFSGRIVTQGKIVSVNQTVNLEQLSNGAYFLQINDPTLKTIKIIKQ